MFEQMKSKPHFYQHAWTSRFKAQTILLGRGSTYQVWSYIPTPFSQFCALDRWVATVCYNIWQQQTSWGSHELKKTRIHLLLIMGRLTKPKFRLHRFLQHQSPLAIRSYISTPHCPKGSSHVALAKPVLLGQFAQCKIRTRCHSGSLICLRAFEWVFTYTAWFAAFPFQYQMIPFFFNFTKLSLNKRFHEGLHVFNVLFWFWMSWWFEGLP